MSKIKFVVPCLVALGTGLLSTSCARDIEAVIVTRALPFDDTGDSCTLSAGGSTALGPLTVDASFDTPLLVGFELQNNLTGDPFTTSNTQIDDSEIYVTDVDVRIDTPQDPGIASSAGSADSSLVEYNTLISSTSFTGGSTMAVAVEVPGATIGALGDAMQATYGDGVTLQATMSVTFHAVRQSNPGALEHGVIDVREFTYVFDLCTNCLRDCSACPDEASLDACLSDDIAATGSCNGAAGAAVSPASCPAAAP